MPLQLNGEGHYVLTDIKNIEVTDQFVGLGRTVTRCQTEEFRLDCQARRQKEKVLSQCRCAPYSLRSHYGEAVPICSAAALDCVRRVALSKDSCLERCHGTVLGYQRLDSSPRDEEGLAKLIAEYENYKNPDNLRLKYPDAMKGR